MIEEQTPRGRIEVGGLPASEREAALDVLARGMRDNPVHVAAFGADPGTRERRLRRLFAAAFAAMDWRTNMLVARGEDEVIVGVCGALAPGACRPRPAAAARLLPSLLSGGTRATVQTLRWTGAWGRLDPGERHWHLGPVAVERNLQGLGIGSAMMSVFCARMDAARENAYLETDREINVRFYERFGFRTTAEATVIGTPNWFMTRRARAR